MIHRRQGSIAIRCPACPEIHVNVDKETVDTAHEDETYGFAKPFNFSILCDIDILF